MYSNERPIQHSASRSFEYLRHQATEEHRQSRMKVFIIADYLRRGSNEFGKENLQHLCLYAVVLCNAVWISIPCVIWFECVWYRIKSMQTHWTATTYQSVNRQGPDSMDTPAISCATNGILGLDAHTNQIIRLAEEWFSQRLGLVSRHGNPFCAPDSLLGMVKPQLTPGLCMDFHIGKHLSVHGDQCIKLRG